MNPDQLDPEGDNGRADCGRISPAALDGKPGRERKLERQAVIRRSVQMAKRSTDTSEEIHEPREDCSWPVQNQR